MDIEGRHIRDSRERLSALLLAAAATFLVFAAINAGFAPHAALGGHVLGHPMLTL